MEQTARVVGLGAIDRIVLVAAWLVSCGAVYGLGFYTGSQTQDRLRDDEERVVRLPISDEPPPVGERTKAADDLTFWGVLESGGRRSKPGDGIPVQRPQATAAVEPATPDEPDRRRAKPRASGGETARPSGSSAAARKAGSAKATKSTGAKTGASKAPARRSGGDTASRPATAGTSATARPSARPRAKAPATRPPGTRTDDREKPRAPQPAAGATAPAAERPKDRGTPGSTAATPRPRASGAGGRERAAVARSGVPPE